MATRLDADISQDELQTLVWTDPERMHGEPCFRDTRIPVSTLFDMLARGGTIDEFVDGFPAVTRERATKVVRLAATGLIGEVRTSPGERASRVSPTESGGDGASATGPLPHGRGSFGFANRVQPD